MNVKVVNKSKHPLPQYQTAGAAGMDLHANLTEPIIIEPGQRHLIPSGIHVELPVGYELQLRPRSGLALKHGISIVNTPGTVDSDYRGELMVLLINHGNEEFTVEDGDRIAQMVITKHATVKWQEVDELTSETDRGKKGFGRTGK